jgi:toxin ParE1/3/4
VDVVFTPLAERHIDRLHSHIEAKAGHAIADGYIARILDCCDSLRTFPKRGAERDDLMPGLRTIGFERRITIAFVIATDRVLIEGIFYGGQDFEAVFKGNE